MPLSVPRDQSEASLAHELGHGAHDMQAVVEAARKGRDRQRSPARRRHSAGDHCLPTHAAQGEQHLRCGCGKPPSSTPYCAPTTGYRRTSAPSCRCDGYGCCPMAVSDFTATQPLRRPPSSPSSQQCSQAAVRLPTSTSTKARSANAETAGPGRRLRHVMRRSCTTVSDELSDDGHRIP